MTGSKYICKCATGYKGESCESKSTFKKVVDAGKGLVDKGKQLLNTGKQVLDLVNDITGGDSDDSGGGLIDTIGSLVNKFTHNGNDEVYIDNERFKEEPDYPDYGDGDDDEDEDYPDYGDGDDDEDEDNNDDEDNEDYGDDGDDDDNDDDNADDGEVDDDEDEGDFRKRSLDVQESSELGKRSVPESGVKLSPPCGPGCIQGEHKAKLEKLYT